MKILIINQNDILEPIKPVRGKKEITVESFINAGKFDDLTASDIVIIKVNKGYYKIIKNSIDDKIWDLYT